MNVTNVNEAPSVTAPTTITAEHDVPELLTGISVADVDAGDTLTLTLTAGDGTFTVGDVTGGADVAGEGTDTLTLSGTVAEINTTLADADGVTYLNDVGFAGTTDTRRSARRGRRRALRRRVDHDPVQPAARRRRPERVHQRGHGRWSSPSPPPTPTTTTLLFTIVDGPDDGTLGTIGTVDCTTVANTCTASVTYTPTATSTAPTSSPTRPTTASTPTPRLSASPSTRSTTRRSL